MLKVCARSPRTSVLKNRVIFLGQRSDVPRLMSAVDVVVHTSVDPEPFGRTLVEAMLARTAVIATDAGAAAEILAGRGSGETSASWRRRCADEGNTRSACSKRGAFRPRLIAQKRGRAKFTGWGRCAAPSPG